MIARLVDQLRPPPTAAEAERMALAIYASRPLVDGYAASAADVLDDLETQVADRHLPASGRILDVGCGGGREAFGFRRRGLAVVGVDLSAPLIEKACTAAQELDDISFVTGSAATIEFPPASFDALWMASEVYAEIPGRAMRVAVLRRLAAFVRPDGRFVIFANVGRGHRRTRWLLDAPRRVLAPLLPRLCSEPGDRILRDPMASGAPFYRHHFDDETEVRSEFEDAGRAFIDRIGSAFVLS
jgi:SAM-dependent methyltransferase